MKKSLKYILIIALAICLCACGKKDSSDKDPIIRDWELSYFTIGNIKTPALGIADEPHIEFTETDMTFTNNSKPHNGTWERLEDGTYEIIITDAKIPPASAVVDGDTLTFTMYGKNNDLVFVFTAKN